MTFSEMSKPLQVFIVFSTFCIIYLLFRSPEVVVQQASAPSVQPAAPASVAAVPELTNISPIVREGGTYSIATRNALKLESGDLEIGRFNIYLDPETRCQYLRPLYRDGLTPRLRKDGKPWCD